jgi:exonuclease SbcC
MIPYELTLCNFMCYRDNVPPLRLDGLHVACLSGDNGAGKSALLDAITWALWGKARMSDDDLIAQGEREMLVDLSFVLNGQHYRVTRRRQRGKTTKSGRTASGKSTLEFQVRGDNGWRSLGETTLTETERKIEQVLRMKYDTFINASFLLQGRADEFTRKTPGERKQVLVDMLGLHEYDQLAERAKKRASTLKEKISELGGRIGQLKQEADKIDLYTGYVEQAEAKQTECSAQLEQAEQQQCAADEAVRRLEELRIRHDHLADQLKKLRGEQQQQQEEMDQLRRKIADDEAVLQRRDEIQAGMAALNEARDARAHLEELQPRYDELIKQQRQQQDRLKDETRNLQSELERRQHEAQRLRDQAARIPQIEQGIQDSEQQLEALAPLAAQLDELRAQCRQLAAHLSSANTLVLRRGELAATIEKRRAALAATRDEQQRAIRRLEGQLRKAEHLQRDLEEAQKQQHDLERLAPELEHLRKEDQETTEQIGELRAQCTRYKEQADDIKQRQAWLENQEATACPLCRSDLGAHGVATVHEHYEQELQTLRDHYRKAQETSKASEATLQKLRTRLEQLDKRVQQARQGAARVETLQQQVQQAQEWQTELEQARAAMADATQQLEQDAYEPEARAALRGTENELSELSALYGFPAHEQGNWAALVQYLEDKRATDEQQQTSLQKQLDGRAAIETRLATQRHELKQLDQDAANLPAAEASAKACADTLQRGDYAPDVRQALREIDASLESLGYTPDMDKKARKQVQELEHWQSEQHKLDMANSRLESNQGMLQREDKLFTRRAEDIERLHDEQTQLDEQLRKLPAAQQHAQQYAEAANTRRQELRAAENDLIEKRGLLNKAREDAEQLAQREAEQRSLSERQGIFQELTEAFGKKGVQAMLIETAIPEIEREANHLLGRITDNQMHVTFEMQRSTKKGDTVETLDIRIADALGTRNYDAFSGGEATRINLAIRIALSRLLAARAGASLETLVIDEGMGALDAEGRERFVEAITSVQHDFKRILVITHLEDLKDRFPARIEVTKTSVGSTWELV